MERKALLERVYQTAFDYELRYHGCAQSPLAALQDVFEMRDDAVFRSASGLSGGVGQSTLGTCGALTGGSIFISQIFGREREGFDDPQRKRDLAYRLCDKLAKKFVQERGSVLCGEIQKRFLGRSYDLWNKEDYGEFQRVAYGQARCPDIVGKGAVWAAEIILNELDRSDTRRQVRVASGP